MQMYHLAWSVGIIEEPQDCWVDIDMSISSKHKVSMGILGHVQYLHLHRDLTLEPHHIRSVGQIVIPTEKEQDLHLLRQPLHLV